MSTSNEKGGALAIANYFIDLAQEDGEQIQPLKLMKLVYIAYGYALAILDKSIIDPRFDKVEAWRYGPVIPSVYHSFKHFKNNNITEKTVVMKENDGEPTFEVPALKDKDSKTICDMVWKTYKSFSGEKLVKLLHGIGTPWAKVYVAGTNNAIPEVLTRLYYKAIVHKILERKQR